MNEVNFLLNKKKYIKIICVMLKETCISKTLIVKLNRAGRITQKGKTLFTLRSSLIINNNI